VVRNTLPTSLSGTDLDISVDYSKSVSEVFTDFALRYVKQISGLRILSHIHEGDLVEGSHVPSWVPMWNQPKRTEELAKKLNYYHAGGFCDPPSCRVINNVLVLRGCILDEVAWVHEPFSTNDLDLTNTQSEVFFKPRGLELLWENIVRETRGLNVQYDDLHLTLSLTLVAGLTGSELRKMTFGAIFQTFVLTCSNCANDASGPPSLATLMISQN
jgi:hypothetical protein